MTTSLKITLYRAAGIACLIIAVLTLPWTMLGLLGVIGVRIADVGRSEHWEIVAYCLAIGLPPAILTGVFAVLLRRSEKELRESSG
jgi:hypothetical protein